MKRFIVCFRYAWKIFSQQLQRQRHIMLGVLGVSTFKNNSSVYLHLRNFARMLLRFLKKRRKVSNHMHNFATCSCFRTQIHKYLLNQITFFFIYWQSFPTTLEPQILCSSLNVLGYCMFKKMLINVNNVIMYFPERLLIIKPNKNVRFPQSWQNIH